MSFFKSVFCNLQDWFLEKCIAEAYDHYEEQLIKFVFRFFAINIVVSALFSILSFVYGTYFELEVVILSLIFEVGLLFSLRIRNDYKLSAKVYIIYTLFTLTLLMVAMREAHLLVLMWYFIPVVFAHFVLGTRWLIMLMIYSVILLSSIIYLRVNDIHLLDTSLVGKYNLDYATPISLIPALGVFYFLLSMYSATGVSANAIISRQNQEILESKILKDNIVHVVAHDLKSPIASIEGLVNVIELELNKDDTEFDQLYFYLDKVRTLCGYSGNLIHQLLDIEKLKSGNVNLRKEHIDCAKLINSCIENNHASATQKDITLHTDLKNSLQESVYADQLRIEQVLNNLISNAIKFSNPGSKVIVGYTTSNDKVTLFVKDFGIGIPKIQQSVIFDKFTEAKRRGTYGEKTHGLGLSIVHQIVCLHKGKIWIESEVDQGTTFYVELDKG